MFKNIYIYELEKFWSKKSNLLCFILIPISVLISLKYALDVNATAKSTEVIFSSNMNFPITSLQEMLISIFNVIVIIFFTLSFNEEYRKGILRIALLKVASRKKLYLAKILVMIINLLFLITIQFLFSYVIGQLILPNQTQTALFFKKGLYNSKAAAIYTFKYYFLSYITLIAFGSIVEFFSIKCRTITSAVGLSIGTILINFIYIAFVLSIFNGDWVFKFLSISTVYAQFSGMAYFASGVTSAFVLGMFVVIIVFQVLSYISFMDEDYLE